MPTSRGRPMSPKEVAAADRRLAAALAGNGSWAPDAQPEHVVDRALYHGVAGLLVDRVDAWPAAAAYPLRQAARAQAMWEMRHRHILSGVLRSMAEAGVRALLLKGTALAYDLYREPSERSRGDSDILIAPPDLAAAREVLSTRGLSAFLGDPLELEPVLLQEAWSLRAPDGLTHEVDLHWQTLNAAALAHVLPFDEAWSRAQPLPRFSPDANGVPRDFALVLACAHRAQHVLNPYHVGEQRHFGGDRLIWLCDIDRLVRVLDDQGWAVALAATRSGGLSAVVLDGLLATAGWLGTPIPDPVLAVLRAAPQDTPEARYLLAGHKVERVWRDLGSVPGLAAKVSYLGGRLLPPEDFMRARYPGLLRQPLAILHLRRIGSLLAPRLFR